MSRLTRNAAQCGRCNEVVESTHVHDFVWCSCKGVAVDGGLEYPRRVWDEGVTYEDLCEYSEEE